MINPADNVPEYFQSRMRKRDGNTVWHCNLCQEETFPAIIRMLCENNIGSVFVSTMNEQTAREAENRPSPPQPDVQDNNPSVTQAKGLTMIKPTSMRLTLLQWENQ
jgi:hypothetical protein